MALLTSTNSQRRALGIFALTAVAVLIWLSLPVSSGLFLGTLLAFSLSGVYERLLARRMRPVLAAALLALGSALTTVGGLLAVTYFVIVRGVVAAGNLARGFAPEGGLRTVLTRLDEASKRLPFGPIDVTGHVRALASEAALKLTTAFGVVADATLEALLTLFFAILSTYFVLRHWGALLRRAERMLPLHPLHTRVVLDEFQKVGKEVFIGTMLTGVAQGVLAGVGYALGGVPEVVLLALLTAACSLVPAVGTFLVWIPVGVGLIASGRPGAGIFELLWGTLIVVMLSDYVIRPKLVGDHGHVPTLLTFIALFGGVKIFGLIGLIVGPVIAAVALASLRTYDRELCEAEAGAVTRTPEPPPDR